MLQRLQIEWMKLKNYRAFWVLIILYLLSIVGINYITFRVQQNIVATQQAKNMAEMLIGKLPYSFPVVWQMTAFTSSFLLFIPGLLMIMSVTNEYSYKTHRQNIIDGWTRRDFIDSKMLMAIVLTVISTIMVILTAALFGFLEGNEDFSTEHFEYIGYFFIQALSYIMAALLIAVLLKRGALAIGVYFLYTVVIENVIKSVLNHYFNNAGRYMPLQSTDELIPVPMLYKLKVPFLTPPHYPSLLIAVTLYLAAYFIVTARKFEKDDL
jgi:ABC-type transport system involved in multi-copper enzyme maturation permease subunit